MTRLTSTSFARQPLDLVLSATARVRVLRALLAHGGALSVTRLTLDTRLSPPSVRETLRELEGLRVIRVLGSGQTLLYQAAFSHPITLALDVLFAAETAAFEDLKSIVVSAARDARIVAAWPFGSIGRHEDGPDSDVDIAILIDAENRTVDAIASGVRETLWPHGDRTGFRISVIPMPVSDLRRHAA